MNWLSVTVWGVVCLTGLLSACAVWKLRRAPRPVTQGEHHAIRWTEWPLIASLSGGAILLGADWWLPNGPKAWLQNAIFAVSGLFNWSLTLAGAGLLALPLLLILRHSWAHLPVTRRRQRTLAVLLACGGLWALSAGIAGMTAFDTCAPLNAGTARPTTFERHFSLSDAAALESCAIGVLDNITVQPGAAFGYLRATTPTWREGDPVPVLVYGGYLRDAGWTLVAEGGWMSEVVAAERPQAIWGTLYRVHLPPDRRAALEDKGWTFTDDLVLLYTHDGSENFDLAGVLGLALVTLSSLVLLAAGVVWRMSQRPGPSPASVPQPKQDRLPGSKVEVPLPSPRDIGVTSRTSPSCPT